MEEGIGQGCRFYACSPNSPSILFFHGNGEVASDYDAIAPLYNQESLSLFVAEYRGYGSSGGKPTFSTMMADAEAVLNACRTILHSQHHHGHLLVMGRSLGSYLALELACRHQKFLRGLIIESGFATAGALLRHLGFPFSLPSLWDFDRTHLEGLRILTLPTLIIHGEQDQLIPPSEAVELYQNLDSCQKRLVTIPGAGHNDILWVGLEQYFSAMRQFVFQ